MDYNEYNSKGNKKKINISNILNDRQKRAWFILGAYFIIMLIIVAMLRSTYSSNKNKEPNNEVEETEEKNNQNNEKKEKDELDNMFSYIDENNYSFHFKLNYNDEEYITNGKRNNNKFEFTYSNNNQDLYFLGTVGNIKMKKDDSIVSIVFPYTYFNYFDNDILKKVIRASTYNEENKKYEITSNKFNEVLGHNSATDDTNINTIELIVKNNKIVEINVDFSYALSTLDPSETKAIINLSYSDFGLIDDFNASFE